MKKKGFIATIAAGYAKGKKVLNDYQEGANKRDMEAAERLQAKTKALKAKAQAKNAYAKAKADYAKAKGGGGFFGGQGKSMFEGASFGGGSKSEPMFQGTIGGGGNGYGAGAWNIGQPAKAPQKRKKRASKPKYKKVVYYR